MYLVFNLVSIVALCLLNRPVAALSFTGTLNPFASKPAPRSQLTSIDAGAFNADTYANGRTQQPNVQLSSVRPGSLPAVRPDDGSRAKWPNTRFMRTFLRNGQVPTGAPSLAAQPIGFGQFNDGAQFNPKYILGYNPTSAEQSKQLAKLPAAGQRKQSLNENADQSMGLIDWNKILARLNQATGHRNANLNETAIQAAKNVDAFYSGGSSNDKKEEEEKESNNGLINYFATFFSSNETIQAEKEKQLAKQKLIGDSRKKQPTDPVDLFYFNDNLLTKKQIEVLICDKTMAIVNVRKNRSKTSRTVLNCVLFDLEKRGKEAEEIVKKLNINKVETDFFTMMDIIDQCRPFSEKSNKIEASVEFENPTSIKAKPLPPGNSFKINNLTISSNLNMQTDNKSTLNLMTGIVSGTLWCGLGDLAKNYTDLGPRKELDICCRAHDHCPIRLKALRYGYGLINFGISTKSHCQCDRDFYGCLKNVGTKLSNTIGNVYFNVLKLPCIEEGPTCVEFSERNNTKKECIREKNAMQFKPPKAY